MGKNDLLTQGSRQLMPGLPTRLWRGFTGSFRLGAEVLSLGLLTPINGGIGRRPANEIVSMARGLKDVGVQEFSETFRGRQAYFRAGGGEVEVGDMTLKGDAEAFVHQTEWSIGMRFPDR